MVILLGTGIYGLAGMIGSGKEVEVPNLKGMDVDTARNTLEKLNLILVEAGEETSEEYPEGTIMQMNPEAGNKVKENTQVRVIVSGGENKLKMPDVTEYDFNKAKDMLEKLGITNIETVEDYSDNVNKGEIISQTPAKDTEISKDDKVTLVISKGAKIKYINVPSVVGLSESAAKEKLSNNGVYNISTQTGKTDDISKNGTVISQSDSGNVKLGVTITLTIGQYEEPVKQGNTNSESDTNTNTNTNTNINKPNNNSNTSQQNPNNNNNSNNNDNNSNNSSGPNAGNNENKQPEGPWDEENVPTSAEPEKAPSEE